MASYCLQTLSVSGLVFWVTNVVLSEGKKVFGIYLEQNMLGVKINLKCYQVASGVEFVVLEML